MPSAIPGTPFQNGVTFINNTVFGVLFSSASLYDILSRRSSDRFPHHNEFASFQKGVPSAGIPTGTPPPLVTAF